MPTYGCLIDLHKKYGDNRDKPRLIKAFKAQYPNIYIGRPDRFHNTITRIVLPTIPTAGKSGSISDLAAYRAKVWKPRLRNTTKISAGMFTLYSISTACIHMHAGITEANQQYTHAILYFYRP